jgi:hypothetical protein
MRTAPLVGHINHIIFVRSEEKVVRVDTTGGITVMQDKHTWGNRAVMEFVRKAVCLDFSFASRKQFAIPFPVEYACPKPTGIGFRDKLPESSLNRDYSSHFVALARTITSVLARKWFIAILAQVEYIHGANASLIGVSQSPAVRAARGFLMPNYSTNSLCAYAIGGM